MSKIYESGECFGQHWIRIKDDRIIAMCNRKEDADFLLEAANRHHELEEKVERLRNELSRLQATCGEEDFKYVQELLDETEATK